MSEMILRMPSTYVNIDREEMEYVDGGYFINVSDKYVAWTVDLSLLFFGGAKLAEGIAKAMVKLGRYEVAAAISYVTYNVTNWLGKNQNYSEIFSKVNGVLGIIAGFSVGNAVAYVLDTMDLSGYNGKIQF